LVALRGKFAFVFDYFGFAFVEEDFCADFGFLLEEGMIEDLIEFSVAEGDAVCSSCFD